MPSVSFEGDLGGWPGVIARLVAKVDLSEDEASVVLREVLSGRASEAQLGALLVALRMKGETVGEMTGFVSAMLEHAERLEVPVLGPGDGGSGHGGPVGKVGATGDLGAVDTCGTGGDRSRSINVSTIAALVAAGAGAVVCKHGGRAASSAAGSADVLEALGVVVDLGPKGVERCIAEAGIGFCFAPRFHPAMRHAAPVRKQLGVPTVFNFLGPLANPARVSRQLLGVSDPAMAAKMAGVLAARGCDHAMVVRGQDGLDEISTTSPTEVIELFPGGETKTYVMDATDFGMKRATMAELMGGDAATNAAILRRVLAGEGGPHRDITLVNAGASLKVAGLAEDIRGGISMAAESIDSGAASRCLERLVETSQACRADGL